jgi:hypothetical protein
MNWLKAVGPLIVIAAAGIVLSVWREPGLIRFWPFSAGEFVQLITPLVLVALFIERALEVFLTAWRGKGSANIGLEIKNAKSRLAQGEAGAKTDLQNSERTHTDYKSDTQRVAFLAALALGIVVSALGVRGLSLFVDPAAFKELSSSQRTWFNAIDVLLTGALLGGGSEGLHKLVTVFTNFMDTAAKKAKGDG